MKTAIVYTETVVHAAPEQFVADAPYQLAIVEFEDHTRSTVRIAGDRVSIGDPVTFAEERSGIPFYRRA
ncbi:MAG: OB-fold domain-containing protein [Acidobacteriota bacterium]